MAVDFYCVIVDLCLLLLLLLPEANEYNKRKKRKKKKKKNDRSQSFVIVVCTCRATGAAAHAQHSHSREREDADDSIDSNEKLLVDTVTRHSARTIPPSLSLSHSRLKLEGLPSHRNSSSSACLNCIAPL